MTEQLMASRGAVWFARLTANAPALPGYSPALRVADADLGGQTARYLAVVPDPLNRFPRARQGEVGLVEGWELARAVRQAIAADLGHDTRRPIVAVIDVSSQAYGRREEGYGIHQALAGAAAAYAEARLAGHPVIGLIVGKAMSGAFLAHGYQANRLIALEDPEVMVHAMGKASAARVTLRSVAELEAFAAKIPPMAYDIDSFASLGLLWRTLKVSDASQPGDHDVERVRDSLVDALRDVQGDPDHDLRSRLNARHREASRKVRQLLQQQWPDPAHRAAPTQRPPVASDIHNRRNPHHDDLRHRTARFLSPHRPVPGRPARCADRRQIQCRRCRHCHAAAHLFQDFPA